MTGAELKKLRQHLGEAIGQPLSVADMLVEGRLTCEVTDGILRFRTT